MKGLFKLLCLVISLKASFVSSGWAIHDSSQVKENVKVYFFPLYNRAFKYKLEEFEKIYTNELFNTSRPTAIYVHGFKDDGQKDHSSLAIKSAYHEKNDTNVITIDWQFYSKSLFYKNSVIPQLKVICETLAESLKRFLDLGYDVDKTYMIGHSLGAQCIGLASRTLKKISNYTIPKLYGLDPAGPGFEKENSLTKVLKYVTLRKAEFDMISKDDAKYVQIIHTNGGKYGMIGSRGHADFFPNGGTAQVGCKLSSTDDVCSHSRAWVYYQESIIPRREFYAIECGSYDDFKNGTCQNNTIAKMGYSDKQPEGNFYLVTHANHFYTSLGVDGLDYKNSEFITEERYEVKNILRAQMFGYSSCAFIGLNQKLLSLLLILNAVSHFCSRL